MDGLIMDPQIDSAGWLNQYWAVAQTLINIELWPKPIKEIIFFFLYKLVTKFLSGPKYELRFLDYSHQKKKIFGLLFGLMKEMWSLPFISKNKTKKMWSSKN